MTMEHGNKLEVLISASGLTKKEFAEKFGVSYHTLYRYKEQKNDKYVTFLIDVADYYGVTLDWLMSDNPKPEGLNLTMLYATEQELKLLKQYRSLNYKAKQMLDSFLDLNIAQNTVE